MGRKVIVAGVYGVIGRAAATLLASQPDTEVIGLSRRAERPIDGVRSLSVDLLTVAKAGVNYALFGNQVSLNKPMHNIGSVPCGMK